MASRIGVLKVIATSVALLGLVLFLCFARVTVRNDSGITLANVTISGVGFEHSVAELKPGRAHLFWFIPSGDTGVLIAFHAAGRYILGGLHGYFQAPPGPQPSGTIVVDPGLRTTLIR